MFTFPLPGKEEVRFLIHGREVMESPSLGVSDPASNQFSNYMLLRLRENLSEQVCPFPREHLSLFLFVLASGAHVKLANAPLGTPELPGGASGRAGGAVRLSRWDFAGGEVTHAFA